MVIRKNIFYTYVYLDPRYNGNYIFNSYTFNHLPIYVGKGCSGRAEKHWKLVEKGEKLSGNNPFVSKLKSLYNKGYEPIIIKLIENVNEDEAFNKEIELIEAIGRKDLNMGSLLNRTHGGDGTSGYIFTVDVKKKMSIIQLKRYENPIERQKISDAMIKHHESDAGIITRNKLSQILSGREQTKDWTDKRIDATTKTRRENDNYKFNSSVEGRQKNSEGGKRRWGNTSEERKEEIKENQRSVWTEEKRIELSKKLKENPTNIKPIVVNFIEYDSLKIAVEKSEISAFLIRKKIKNNEAGYQWLGK